MHSKNRILKRINFLYILFFFVIVAAAVFSFIGTDVATGFSDAVREVKSGESGNSAYFFEVPNKTHKFGYDLYVGDENSDALTVAARPAAMDIIIKGDHERLSDWHTVMSSVLFGLSVLCYIAIFALLFMTIGTLRKSVRTGTFFERKNILYSRLIGVLLICASVFLSLSKWLENLFVSPLVNSGHFIVDTSLSFSFGEIVMGLLILFMAEIFAVGYDIVQEQKLTI